MLSNAAALGSNFKIIEQPRLYLSYPVANIQFALVCGTLILINKPLTCEPSIKTLVSQCLLTLIWRTEMALSGQYTSYSGPKFTILGPTERHTLFCWHLENISVAFKKSHTAMWRSIRVLWAVLSTRLPSDSQHPSTVCLA